MNSYLLFPMSNGHFMESLAMHNNMRINIIAIMTFFISLLIVSNTPASEYLNSEEIRKVISGNSITGIWEEKEFKQNVHPGGIAVVNIAGMKLFNIPWIANDRNEYCENWGDWGWNCFKLKKVDNNKYLSVRTSTADKNKETDAMWTIHPGFIDINL